MSNIYNTIAALTGTTAPNFDQENGIHYGVIHSNDCMSEALEDIYSNGTDLDWQDAKEEMQGTVTSVLSALLSDETLSALASRLQSDTEDQEALETLSEAVSEKLRESLSEYLSSRTDWHSLASDVIDNWSEPLDKQSESLWSDIEDGWSDYASMGQDGASRYRYEADGYILELDRDGDIFVIKSPYYTECGYCSPCAPNAGYLTSSGSNRSYALGSDWFEDNRLPYRLFSVASGKPVIPVASYRLQSLQRPGQSRVFRLEELMPIFKADHRTEAEANAYALACGFSSWSVWTNQEDGEVTEAEADAYHETNDQETEA